MSYIVILIAAPQAGPLSTQEAQRAMEFCGGQHLNWLAPQATAEFIVKKLPDIAQLKLVLSHKATDILLTRFRGRRKALLVADMDSTMITTETLDELAAFAGIKDKIVEITKRAMNGEIDFATALRERVAMLKGLELSALERTWRETEFCPGARTLIATMRHYGATTALVSGGFTYFTERVAAALGFDIHRANILLDNGSQLTGEVAEPILDKNAKVAALTELAEKRGIKLSATLAVGDGANDLPMLKEAGLGVAYYAKPVVAEQVLNKIEHTDLTSLLFAQGYPASAFRT
ncbi:MAG: phosphoserine phosphatase SerB [Acidocella sp. 20-57-95]|nr:MAG: phosphoserine phosphatase SerB [Acidocella sp. 20-57-95]OYV61715.1 MAG: phosphoserine phosphatase SerB [Acidocella sp. 21-58-7]HQT64286.1 phosphoserine phosphatase SerB [Acidocella sp.]HQU04879.1 phosphoserine phosphatase SerB [Acidocella sp.]